MNSTVHLGSTDREIAVGIADYDVTTTNATLTTNGLGSCLGIALFDETAGVAGLIHVKLPAPGDRRTVNDAEFADLGIELLVAAMEREGAARSRLEAKIAGGSDMCGFTWSHSDLGERNVEQAEATLAELDIPVVGRDVGGDHARSLRLDGATGELTVRYPNRPNTAL